ncbi:MAG: PucR family transcriptional regulator ligand-binding domain-containing protein [Chloroflexota bacterium]
MLTVQQLLTEPIFTEAVVVAGKQSLKNIVGWSHIIDVPNVAGMVEPRNLIITTGQGIVASQPQQLDFIRDLVEAHVSGLVVSVGGEFFQTIPQPMLDEANKHQFPIITIPSTVRFVDITRTVHEQLISQQYTLLKRSDYIHQTLTQVVLEGGQMQDLADLLARLVHRSITIENPELNRLFAYATHGEGELDIARQESIQAGKTPPLIRKHVLESGILEEAKQRLQPVIVPAAPEVGMTDERYVAPIVVGREIYGYVWLIAGDDPLDESDRMAIERAAVVAALIMLNETAVRQTEARLQSDLISQILSGQAESISLLDRANRLGLDLQQPQRVLLLKPPDDVLPSLRLADEFRTTIQEVSPNYIIQPLGRYLILILPDEVATADLCIALTQRLSGLKISIGRTASALVNLAQSHREAEEAMEIGQTLATGYDIYDFDELGFLPWLYHLPKNTRLVNPYIQRISRLATEERAARAQLLQTLEVLLDCGNNASETARVLGIHRNTLTYRLKQIEALCDVSLANPEVRLNLQIAIKAYHLQDTGNDDN